MTLPVSVLIPSWQRRDRLERCLRALAAQTAPPAQVIVVWQADDAPTRDRAEALRGELPFPLEVLHSPEAGVVPAENLALGLRHGELVALIDDDAEAPPDWLARHAAHFADPSVGAVGGAAVNHVPDGTAYPKNTRGPHGRLPWHGMPVGNMYDHPPEWRDRPPQTVDHLVGYNLVLRRSAFGTFEAGLRRYWQLFELDACLQVKGRGFRVVFDFANTVRHFPTNTTYGLGRDRDLQVGVYNGAYNLAFVLGKHSPWYLVPVRLGVQLLAGRVAAPGLLAAVVACRRYGHPLRELRILGRTWMAALAGWRDGLRRRGAR